MKEGAPRHHGLGLVFYRGENIDRFDGGSIGTSRADKQATADVYAETLNAAVKGEMVMQSPGKRRDDTYVFVQNRMKRQAGRVALQPRTK